MSEKVWADVPGWPGYRVSDDGVVQSCRNSRCVLTGIWRTLTPAETEDGYWRVKLVNAGRHVSIGVHTLVLICHGTARPPGRSCALHFNGQPKDNRIANLRWGFDQDNADDRDRHGTTARGEWSGRARLTADDILAIRAEWKRGEAKQPQIARQFGISRSYCGDIIRGKKWKHIPLEN